jgi:hypothetical protein
VGSRNAAQSAPIFDLIAGNGGDVVNYGTIIDPKAFVGKAGSILNVSLSGDVGQHHSCRRYQELQ